jgi:hypothetical protein
LSVAHSARWQTRPLGSFTVDGRRLALTRDERRLVRSYHRAVTRHLGPQSARHLSGALARRLARRQ